ncbi:hypothetical protein BSKO_12716 [Bryopsis sp. KO-2023]|nr:hypothetical protein BSKO_12716 [Bryopsis sp. KO-2023]
MGEVTCIAKTFMTSPTESSFGLLFPTLGEYPSLGLALKVKKSNPSSNNREASGPEYFPPFSFPQAFDQRIAWGAQRTQGGTTGKRLGSEKETRQKKKNMTQTSFSIFDLRLNTASVVSTGKVWLCRKTAPNRCSHLVSASAQRWAVAGEKAGVGVRTGNRRNDRILARCQVGEEDVGRDISGERKSDVDEADVLAGIRLIIALLPESVRPALESRPDLVELVEVVMDLGRAPLARFPEAGDVPLSEELVTTDDLDFAIDAVGEFGGDNRAGIEGTLHRISCIRNRDGKIVGLTCRVGRDVQNSASLANDLILSGKSILFMGRPGVGKTTVIRGICQTLADVCQKRVVIVDTSNEIGGDGDVAHPGIGRARRMQVPRPEEQHHVMIEAVENHMPEVIVIDEIGTEMECQAARTISQRGVQLVATAHGCELENVIKNPSLQDLVGGITSVTLGDEEARRRRVQKTILERAGPPAFDVAIEMLDRDTWRIHHDLAAAVDAALAGAVEHGEIRSKDSNGEITSKQTGRPAPPTLPLQPETSSSAVPLSPSFSGRPKSTGSSLSAETTPLESMGSNVKRLSISEDESLGWEAASSPNSAGVAMGAAEGEEVARRWFDMGGQREGKQIVLTLYLLGVDVKLLWEVVGAMELREKVAITPYLKEADAILGTKTKLKLTGWVRQASRASGIPLFPIKTSSASQLVKGLQSLLGLYPSSSNLASSADNVPSDLKLSPANDGGATPATLSSDEEEALAEVQIAIEEIVLPRGQPIELLPRLPTVIKMQMEIVKGYDLDCETVGSGNSMRLRILPSASNSTNDDSLRDAAFA